MRTEKCFGKLSAIVLVAAVVFVPFAGAQAIVTGFPDSDAGSGRFVNLTRGLSSLGGDETQFGIIVLPVAQFRLAIFDGDMSGRWDVWSPMTATPDQTVFTLYADPSGTGSQTAMVGQWDGGAMPDAGWFETTVGNVAAARTPSGNYRYILVVSWMASTLANEQNNFKLVVEGQILAPGGGGTYGFIGYTPNDPSPEKFSPSTYDGRWQFHLLVAPGTSAINLWNGDFDRADDTMDANSPTLPPFTVSPATLPEGIRPGVPADDAASGSPLLVSPAIFQWLGGPEGGFQATDENPSGNREWEVFRVGLAGTDPDVAVASLPAGQYEWWIEGADGRNTLFVATDGEFYTELPGKIGDFVWLDCSDDGQHSVGFHSVGIQCTDPCREGIPNVGIDLWFDGDGNGAVDTKLGTTTTDANGYYLFEDLVPGLYEPRVVPGTLPPGLLPIYDFDGIATPHVAKVTLGVAEVNLQLDFGYVAELPGEIGDFVWLDCSNDSTHSGGIHSVGFQSVGTQCTDPCRQGIPNVGIELWVDGDGNGAVETRLRSTRTDSRGYYLFGNLMHGLYETRVVPGTLPSGLVATYDYDGIATENVAKVRLGVGESNLRLDFGYDERPTQRFQGCTPGYWKQSQHFDSWVGYRPWDKYNRVFGVPYVKTLLQALQAGGGGEKALGRHAAAALLNTTNPKVHYYYTTGEVISMVQQAYSSGQYESIKNLLENQNEAGCPLH